MASKGPKSQGQMSIVLLVDDDPMQALVRKSLLESRFRTVLRAADASEALCMMEKPQFASQVGLVISGLRMPGLGGPAFAAELHARVPEVPILVLETQGESAAPAFGPWVRFLGKPFAPDEMLAVATQMLAASAHT